MPRVPQFFKPGLSLFLSLDKGFEVMLASPLMTEQLEKGCPLLVLVHLVQYLRR